MNIGVKIAKDGFTIDDEPSEQYVDTETALLKVMKNVSGAIVVAEGGAVTSVGDYQWVRQTVSSGSVSYYIDISYVDGIDYAPQFEAYLDQESGSKRMRLGNLIGGISSEGTCNGFVSGGSDYVRITASIKTLSPAYSGIPIPGSYGYFAQIYYDRAQEEG